MARTTEPGRGQGSRPGSVKWREDRRAWEARVRLPNGKRPCRYFRHEKEGWDWIVEQLGNAQRGRYITQDNRKTGDILTEWVETVAPRTLRPNSLYNYRLYVGYMLPWIGGIKVGQLARPDIERMLVGLQRGEGAKKPLSAHTLNCSLRVLKQALEYAVDADYLPRNPAKKITPFKETQTRVALSVEQCRRILIASRGERWYAVYMLLATTGLRISEALGLEWDDIRWDRRVLHVRQQTGRVYGEPGVRLGPPKTPRSWRTVGLDDRTLDVLRRHQHEQHLERISCPPAAWEDNNLVFCSHTGGKLYRSQVDNPFHALVTRLGIEATPHTFRHTLATLLQEHGNSIAVAQTVLGHTKPDMTLRYTHASDDTLERARQTTQALFGDLDEEGEEPLTEETGS